ncbi:Hypothetical protein R9X50_00060800 [Acrodontium crateriforme]|uniref:HSF-type DNA-binding domain-containing protein n=1 Tax=Acrodontium crateriforme TaxID=150365 RepID=A0AAQ3LY62_9PEZI|nr:Hypothetical protein R9X50_00060800 [Acrodontium crateriforme]
MQQSAAPQKRAAPGVSSTVQQPGQGPNNFQYSMPDNSDFGTFDFSQPFGTDQSFNDPSTVDNNSLAQSLNSQQGTAFGNPLTAAASTDLVRRARNQQLAAQNGKQPGQWEQYGPMNTQPGQEDEQDLDMRVQMAKRDAQGKRKQIPPFVQKLSSFLDSNNTDLIRWSDDGRSFIVLDEDEFARTLIPELFKHNNYASFVRQLNMYGFHKTVNITDGSLRQSEKARKGVKPPSMYSHPYFRKNRPDLLWLIQKPGSKTTAKRRRDGTMKDDSDDERNSPGPEGKPLELGNPGSSQDLVSLPRNELVAVRTELSKLQAQQKFISKMIAQLKEQNDQFYRQATAFQALHDRHENSINAILTFLATFYNRSLDGTGAANLVNMFNNQNSQAQHGSVVEEFNDTTPVPNQQVQRYKKPQLLLPGPSGSPQNVSHAADSINPLRQSGSPPMNSRENTSSIPPQSAHARASSASSPMVKDDAPTPDILHQIPENDQIMSLINNVNASNGSTLNTSAIDFSAALDHCQNADGNAPLTAQQRRDVLSLMASQQGNASHANALISPEPPAMPDLNHFRQTQQQLEMLTNMQKQQDSKVQELNRRLQPLSPTGAIPGVGSEDENPFEFSGAPGDYDPGSFINFDDPSWHDGQANDINFDFGTSGDNNIDWDFGDTVKDSGAEMFQTADDTKKLSVQSEGTGGRVESVSSAATTPAADAQESNEVEPGTPRKRTRRS